MNQEIFVKIRGLQMADGEQNTVETIHPGQYYLKNEKHYILYEELDPDDGKVTKNRIKVSPGYMELYKNGVTNVHMVFEEGKKNVTYYYTPYGSLLIGIEANLVEVKTTPDTICIDVDYVLEINNEYAADCHIHVEATENRKIEL